MRYPNIEAERARRGLTKVQLAKLLGVCDKTLYNWYAKGIWPTDKLYKLADMWGCTVDYLLQSDLPLPDKPDPLYC